MFFGSRFVALLAIATALLGLGSACSSSDSNARHSVVLIAFDTDRKIGSIKAIREETGLGLADAKRLVEETPSVVRVGLTRSEADALAARLRARGMTVELQAD
jgi:large subunit ribosomal protein L7/L12